MTKLPTSKSMYSAIEKRDESYVGVFVVAVKTTKIFCRPGCPARTPLAKNVEFFATANEALHAGYRPCRRCRPMDKGDKPPQWVAELMRRVDECPERRFRDRDLRELGIEPERARRTFKSRYGMTFQAYARARRMGLALGAVKRGQDVYETALDHGFESDSGFRDAFERLFGATPSRSDAVRVLACRWIESPLGPLLAAADDEGLALLEFLDRRMLETQLKRLQSRIGCVLVPGQNSILEQTSEELTEYFGGKRRNFTVPLVLAGSSFQQRVWQELLKIPYGRVTSYSETARQIGQPSAVRAVGKANGDNRISIIVPCHRVVRSDGSLCGYGGGLWRKQRLLDLESGTSQIANS